jgi:hypothetical protein
VFDEYSKKVNQFVVESKFIEATQKLVEYGNREFLRSFQLRTEIINGKEQTTSKNNTSSIINIADITPLPPFQTVGFLETKWLEVLKEFVEYGNKNILGNFKLYLVMEEKRQEETKEVTNGILDIKREERRTEVHNSTDNNNNNHNKSWFRPRDKFGRFISTSTSTSTSS